MNNYTVSNCDGVTDECDTTKQRMDAAFDEVLVKVSGYPPRYSLWLAFKAGGDFAIAEMQRAAESQQAT